MFKTLLSREHLLKRETIIDEVGVEALEGRHLIGHEDTIPDMVVDILIRLFKSSRGIKIETFGFFRNRQKWQKRQYWHQRLYYVKMKKSSYCSDSQSKTIFSLLI